MLCSSPRLYSSDAFHAPCFVSCSVIRVCLFMVQTLSKGCKLWNFHFRRVVCTTPLPELADCSTTLHVSEVVHA